MFQSNSFKLAVQYKKKFKITENLIFFWNSLLMKFFFIITSFIYFFINLVKNVCFNHTPNKISSNRTIINKNKSIKKNINTHMGN